MSDIDDPRLSALYRQAPADEPAPAVDEAILRAARAAVSGRPRRAFVPWAVAATLVLGVGIGWRVLQLSPGQMEPAMPISPAAVEVDADAESDVRESPPGPAPARIPAEVRAKVFDAPVGTLFESSPRQRELHKAKPAAQAAVPAAASKRVTAEGIGRRAADEGAADVPAIAGCEGPWPADDASAEDWRVLIARARANGELSTARCLEQRYRQRFGGLPAAPVSRPAPDR